MNEPESLKVTSEVKLVAVADAFQALVLEVTSWGAPPTAFTQRTVSPGAMVKLLGMNALSTTKTSCVVCAQADDPSMKTIRHNTDRKRRINDCLLIAGLFFKLFKDCK